MWLKHLCVDSLIRLVSRVSPADRAGRVARRHQRIRPCPEALETRLVLQGTVTTYTWIGAGDGTSFNDPNNWSHIGSYYGGIGVTGVPTIGSNLYFPPVSTLPANSPTTIHFNAFASFSASLVTIDGSYTFTGNGLAVANGILVTSPLGGPSSDATIQLSTVSLGRQSTLYTQSNSTLNIGDADDLTGLQLTLQGGVTAGGGGQVVIDTQTIFDPETGFTPQTFEVAGGTVTLGTTMDFSNTLFQVDANASLDVADDAAVKVASLSGSGSVDLEGTDAADDTTSLTAYTRVGESDQLTGTVNGLGQFAQSGNGSLTLGGIDFGDGGAVDVLLGTLDVDGPIAAGTLQVNQGGTFGGVGSWSFSGPVTFQPGSTFDVTLDGLEPGTQYTQLTSGDSTTGINLGLSTLAGSVGYEYQAGDSFTIAAAPMVQGAFQNAVNGMVLLGDNIPFSVTYSNTAVTLTALQSETTTQLTGSGSPTNPGQPVMFTATVRTRTAPVTGGTVSFMQGGTVLTTEPVTSAGTATYTTTSLPLGSSTITAVFSGIANILGSTSGSVTQVVVPYSTATMVSSSVNPSRVGQAVTLTATVTADGMPVTSGTVTFTRGSQFLGRAALGGNGTASMVVSTLPRGDVRIQASFSGNPDDNGSVSQTYIQAVAKYQTATYLIAVPQTRPNGKIRTVLLAVVDADGAAGVTPVGSVVFRRGGRVIGRARLVNGTAALAIPARFKARGHFVAQFQGGKKFAASGSAVLDQPA